MKSSLLKQLSQIGLCGVVLAVMSLPADAQCRSCRGGCRSGCQSGCHSGCSPCCSRPGQCQDCCLAAGVKWLIYDDYYICPPDYGWAVPSKVPVVRKGVNYYRYWPEQWYGTGAVPAGTYQQYPMIANPTDTTQLGYTYQQVPYWQPQPGRVPQSPVPSQWHVRQRHHGYNGRWQNSYVQIHSNLGPEHDGQMASGYPCYGSSMPIQPIPMTTPGGLKPVPDQTPVEAAPPPKSNPAPKAADSESAPAAPIAPPNINPNSEFPIPTPPAPEGKPPAKEDKSARRAPGVRNLMSLRAPR